MLRYKTETRPGLVVQHLARKRSGSILTTPEPARGTPRTHTAHKTDRVVIKPDDVAFVAGVEKDRRSVAIPVVAEHQISLAKRLRDREAKVIQLTNTSAYTVC